MFWINLYIIIGLIFIGLYFTGCHTQNLKNGWKIDVLASLFNLIGWPITLYFIIVNKLRQ